MNVRMTPAHDIKLPDDVVEALELTPGSAVKFERGPKGEIILVKEAAEAETPEQISARLERMRGHAGPGMTTDEVMQLLRGDD